MATNDYPVKLQREALMRFRDALNVSASMLKRSESGHWRLEGRHGYVFARAANEFVLLPHLGQQKKWPFTKKALTFCRPDPVFVNGLALEGLPISEQAAELIRERLGLRKRKKVTEELLALLAKGREKSRIGKKPQAEARA